MRSAVPPLLAFTLIGCTATGDVAALPAGGRSVAAGDVDVELDRPVVVGGRWTVTPLSVRVDAGVLETWRTPSETRAFDAAASRQSSAWANAIVRDLVTSDTSLLLDRPGLVVGVTWPVEPPEVPADRLEHIAAEVRPAGDYDVASEVQRLATLIASRSVEASHAEQWPDGLVLLAVVEADTDGDGALTSGDAARLVAVDLATGSRATLTPAGESVERVDLRVIDGGTHVLVTTRLVADEPRERQRRYHTRPRSPPASRAATSPSCRSRRRRRSTRPSAAPASAVSARGGPSAPRPAAGSPRRGGRSSRWR